MDKRMCFWLRSLIIFFVLQWSFCHPAFSQSNDTIVPVQQPVTNMHSPHKATIYALVLPGLGQAYNHKYWKLPIVYAGFGACIYFIHSNTKLYREFRTAYKYASSDVKIVQPPTPVNSLYYLPPPNEWASKYDEEILKNGLEYYHRNLEISYIATGAWYLLTVVDAVVDAHFFDYDINDDLTMKINPWVPAFKPNQGVFGTTGLSLSINF